MLFAKLQKYGRRISQMKRAEMAALVVFSALFALSIVLGDHIILGENYYGSAAENYVSSYSMADAVVFICLLVAIFIASALLYAGWLEGSKPVEPLTFEKLRLKPLALCAGVIAILHLPYLLVYYPGFIFNDSLSSIAQAVGAIGYSNHHPVAYTLIVKFFISIAHFLGHSTTMGCALYSLVQTILMSLSYATVIQWIVQRASLGRVWRVLLVALFGLTPYIATYSIAMWKDPLFSAALVVVSVLVADFVLSSGKIASLSKLWVPIFTLCCLAITLLRSNGILVDALLCIAFTVYVLLVFRARKLLLKVICLIPGFAIAVNLLLVGPIYSAFGVTPNEKVEGLGIPLAQMSRVVAYGGNMSDSDAAYMNELLPLDEYTKIYTPTLIDKVKWDSQFNSAPLEDGFYRHWLSMLVKNPRLYFEAWEMETFGYWTVNHPAVILYTRNITTGVPGTASNPNGADSLGIVFRNCLGESAHELLTYENLSIPVSWVTWALLFLCVVFVISGNGRWLIPLLPSVALLASLLAASPIWYWPRYAAAMQFLIPFYIALPFVVRKANGAKALFRNLPS